MSQGASSTVYLTLSRVLSQHTERMENRSTGVDFPITTWRNFWIFPLLLQASCCACHSMCGHDVLALRVLRLCGADDA